MGLDMYLYGINHFDEIDLKKETVKIKIIKTEEIYWRKSNHIHKWFVDNVQGGHDDCHCYEVSHEDLIKLKEVCESVLLKRDKAHELLPTQSGFFFGSVDYDEYYFYDCQRTVDEINRVLEESNYDYFEYASSW